MRVKTVLCWMWAWHSAQWEEFKWGLEQFHLCALWTRLRSLVSHVIPPRSVRLPRGEIVQLWSTSIRLCIPWKDILSVCVFVVKNLQIDGGQTAVSFLSLSLCLRPTGGSVRATVRRKESSKQHLLTLFTFIALTNLWNVTFRRDMCGFSGPCVFCCICLTLWLTCAGGWRGWVSPNCCQGDNQPSALVYWGVHSKITTLFWSWTT